MEKLIYAVWRPDAMAVREFRRTILEKTGPALLALGVRGLAVNLADDHAVPGLRISRLDPAGTVAVWVDTSLERRRIEVLLHAVTPRLAGWLVLESVPLVNTRHVVPPGERIPGLYTVAFLEKPAELDYATWLQRWQGEHTATAIETQRTFLYVQNVLVRPLTPEAPPWVAIVEEAFPAEAATDPMRFYAARTPAELADQQRRMTASVARFIDFGHFETIPMSAYVLATF